MSLSTAIYTLLQANANLTSLVSTRIEPLRAGQNLTLPCVVYRVDSVLPESTHEAAGVIDAYRVSFSAFADNYLTVEEILAALRTALERQTLSTAGTHIQSASYDGLNDSYDLGADMYGQTATFIIRSARYTVVNTGIGAMVIEDTFIVA